MKKINKKILALIIIISISIIIYNLFSYNHTDYNNVIKELNEKYSNDYEEILINLDTEIGNKNHRNELIVFLKIYYSYLIREYDFVFENYERLEKNLIDSNLREERLELYSIMMSIYSGLKEYEMAYLNIEKAEELNQNLINSYRVTNKEKYAEYLSMMMAIKYMKVTILSNLNLDDLAEKSFKEAEAIEETLNIRDRIDIYNNKFMYYFENKDYENAYLTYEIIKDIPNDKNGNTDEIKVKLLTLLSIMQVENNYIDLAVKNGEILNNIDIEVNDSINLLILELNSYIYEYYNQLDNAIDCLEVAYDIIDDLPNQYRYQSIRILDNIIDMYKLKGDVPEEYYEEYINLIESEKSNRSIQLILGRELDLEVERLEEHQELMFFRSLSIICLLSIITMIITFISIKISQENFKDGLTKIHNRKYFDFNYNKYLKSKKQFYLMVMDIDNFKSINDNYGHDFGDIVLVNVANEIKKSLKNTNCKLFRYGGEEFVILSKVNDRNTILNIAEKIRKNVENITWDKVEKVTISIGVADSKDSYMDTFKVADENLYKSKISGKNKITI